MISFTVAHVCVVVLRFKQPDAERPCRTPLNIPLRGKQLPVLAVLGGIGTFTVWCVVVAHPRRRARRRLLAGWPSASSCTSSTAAPRATRSRETVSKVVVPESMQQDIDYDQILVPITGSRVADEMMVLACQLATEKKSAIDGLYVIEVPLNLPLDARLRQEREKATRRARCGRRRSPTSSR